MDLTRMRRAIVLTAMTALVVTACSSGGAASPSAAASAASTAARRRRPPPTATPEPTAAAVTLEYLVDDSQANQQLAKRVCGRLHGEAPERHHQRREPSRRHRRRQPGQDQARHRRYDGHLLVQLRLAPAGAQSVADARRPDRRAVHRQHRRLLHPDGVAERRDLRRAQRHGDGWRHPVQQEGLRGQRSDASRRPGPSSRPTTTSSRPLGSRRSAPPTRPRTTWTSQLFVLADYCNVQAAVPNFATDYTNNKIKYADTPAALAGFQHLQEGFDKGWYEKDFGAASFDDGLNGLATGKFAQYPMLTFALGTIATNHPEAIQDIGFFGHPGTDAAKNCATIWMPAATYIPKTTTGDKLAAAKDFLGVHRLR